jgi:cytochrome c oxidase accessory protein FixG
MREQICIYACPWPRIQAAMMDNDTITVAYREWRGEPRGKGNVSKRDRAAAERAEREAQATGPGAARYSPTPYPKAASQVGGTPKLTAQTETHGDCIDCMACVNVCPMGIDIRNGQQLECITCALCIDACDDVMDKIGKPRGLIDYLALSDEEAERTGATPAPIWRHILRPRTILYTLMWVSIGLVLVYALFIRSEIELTVSPVRNPTFVLQSDGSIRNIYDVRLRNKSGEDRQFHLSLTSDEILRIELEGREDQLSFEVPADTTVLQRVYITARPQDPAARQTSTPLRLWVQDLGTDIRASQTTIFNGREVQ